MLISYKKVIFCFISDGSFTGRHPLVHETNDARNCSPPSIEEFPGDLFNQRERRLGAVVIHFLVAFYTSWAIAIVCDDYFVPCLELISDLIRWNFNLMWPVLLSWLLVVQLPNYSPQSLVSCKSLCISYAFDARYLLSGIHKCQVHTGLNSFPGFSRRPTWWLVAHHPLRGKSAGKEIAVETRRYSPS